MSTVTMSVSFSAYGCAVAVFKEGAHVRHSGDAVVLGLGKGELLRLGFLVNPGGLHTTIASAVALAARVRRWFNAGPCVGGACVPEVYVLSARQVDAACPGGGFRAAVVAALVMAWVEPDDDEAVVGDVEALVDERRDDFDYNVYRIESIGSREVTWGSLAVAERDLFGNLGGVEHDVALDAVALGLVHLGRTERSGA